MSASTTIGSLLSFSVHWQKSSCKRRAGLGAGLKFKYDAGSVHSNILAIQIFKEKCKLVQSYWRHFVKFNSYFISDFVKVEKWFFFIFLYSKQGEKISSLPIDTLLWIFLTTVVTETKCHSFKNHSFQKLTNPATAEVMKFPGDSSESFLLSASSVNDGSSSHFKVISSELCCPSPAQNLQGQSEWNTDWLTPLIWFLLFTQQPCPLFSSSYFLSSSSSSLISSFILSSSFLLSRLFLSLCMNLCAGC